MKLFISPVAVSNLITTITLVKIKYECYILKASCSLILYSAGSRTGGTAP